MKRLAAILFLASLSLADAQTSYLPWVAVNCLTNAGNTATLWTNVGTDAGSFIQDNPNLTPTNHGDYYSCLNGRSFTSSFAIASETNNIALSWWQRNPSGSGDNGAIGLGNWEGNTGPAMFSAVIGGTWYVGVRKSGSIHYFTASFSDTASFHHLAYSYNRSRTNELIAYLDGVKLTTEVGDNSTTLDLNTYPYAIGFYSSGTNLYNTAAKVDVSHALIVVGYPNSHDLLFSNIFANGRNFYEPPAGGASANPDDNYKAAIQWWRMIQ